MRQGPRGTTSSCRQSRRAARKIAAIDRTWSQVESCNPRPGRPEGLLRPSRGAASGAFVAASVGVSRGTRRKTRPAHVPRGNSRPGWAVLKTAAQVESSRLGLGQRRRAVAGPPGRCGRGDNAPERRAGASDPALVSGYREHPRPNLFSVIDFLGVPWAATRDRRRGAEPAGPLRRTCRTDERWHCSSSMSWVCATSWSWRLRPHHTMRRPGMRNAGWMATVTRGRKSTSQNSPAMLPFCR